MKAKITFARFWKTGSFLHDLQAENDYPTLERMAACHDISFAVEIGDVAELDKIEELAEAYSGEVEFSK